MGGSEQDGQALQRFTIGYSVPWLVWSVVLGDVWLMSALIPFSSLFPEDEMG